MALSRTRKPAPADLYVAITSFAGTDPNGVTFSVAKGDRLRGDNPTVQRAFGHFAPADTPSDELAKLESAALNEALAEATQSRGDTP